MPSNKLKKNTTKCKNVLLVHNDVKDYEIFVSSVNADTFPVVYSKTSKKTELLEVLRANFTTIERIALCFTGGSDRSKKFLDNKSFFSNENIDFLNNVIKSFSVKNIDYLACNTLSNPDWKNYYAGLTKETGVLVGASSDKTGNIKYGGDWVMESSSENIESVYFTKSIEYYSYLLDTQGYCILLIKDGELWGTGYNDDGQLGLGDYINVDVLTQINIPGIRTPKSISCCDYSTIVLMTDGTIWGTGYNRSGQLGLGDDSDEKVYVLTQMNIPDGKIPNYITCNEDNSIVLMTDGTVWGTGSNGIGQLGLGINSDSNIYVLTYIPNSINVAYVVGMPIDNTIMPILKSLGYKRIQFNRPKKYIN